MTMRTSYTLRCPCGHSGSIGMSENDQPYSSCWENYTLRNFKSNGVDSYEFSGAASWKMVFDKLKPICPACDRALTPDHLI